MLSGAGASLLGRNPYRVRPQMVAIPEEHEMCEFQVVHIWMGLSLGALICEIYIAFLGYVISEFYYGLYNVANVLMMYWWGYVNQSGH
jgi:hypothetical protein